MKRHVRDTVPTIDHSRAVGCANVEHEEVAVGGGTDDCWVVVERGEYNLHTRRNGVLFVRLNTR